MLAAKQNLLVRTETLLTHELSRLIGQLLPTCPNSIVKKKKKSDIRSLYLEFINIDFHGAPQVCFLTEHQRSFILLSSHWKAIMNEILHTINFIWCSQPSAFLLSVLGCACPCYWESLFKEQHFLMWQLSVAFPGILSGTDCGSIRPQFLNRTKLHWFHLILLFFSSWGNFLLKQPHMG